MIYLGRLPDSDPLYGYLRHEIMPQLGSDGSEGFRVYSSRSSHAVYIYEDRKTSLRVVGKFFHTPGETDFEQAKRKMYREFNNIHEFRQYMGDCHYTARALGCNENLNCLLAVEYCYGQSLDSVIRQAVFQHDDALLYGKLTALAGFLAHVHNKSAKPVMVDFQKICRYFDTITGHLESFTGWDEAEYLRLLGRRYRENPLMYQDQEVLVHGDATPANFCFGDGSYVMTFDLERMRRSDRLFDTGMIAGELQHFFLRHTGNKYAAEPFISHFLREYCRHFPDRDAAFAAITARVPFYMGFTLLRIARNGCLGYEYRRKLIREAELTLQR